MTPEERARAIVSEWYKGPYNLHVDTSEMEKEIADVAAAISEAVKAEHTRITLMAEAIEQGTYTTTKTVSQVLRSERK